MRLVVESDGKLCAPNYVADGSRQATSYLFNASVGTPAQQVHVLVDTGSSDLWFNAPNSALCTSRGDPCAASGTYEANSSTTYQYINSDFNITYVDGDNISGDYATDVFQVGATIVTDLQFGIGYDSTAADGILGVGYASNEAQVSATGGKTYDNFPAKLVAEGIIGANAYSLWLNDLEASTGNILFGGVDSAKYEGELVTLPIQTVQGAYREFLITLTGVEYGGTTIGSNLALAVVLDSGTSFTYLPDDITEAIYDAVGAVYNERSGAASVPCSLGEQGTSLTFQFSDPAAIVVPMSEMVLGSESAPNGQQFQSSCLFGIAPSGNSASILGDTFLRSAYVVYDLDNNEISIAQTKFNVSVADIAEIGSGSAAVPQSTPAASPVPASGTSQSGHSGKAVGSSSSLTSAPCFARLLAVVMGVAMILTP